MNSQEIWTEIYKGQYISMNNIIHLKLKPHTEAHLQKKKHICVCVCFLLPPLDCA